MTTIVVPYHQDERLPASSLPDDGTVVLDAELPDGDIWQRLAALDEQVARAVAASGPVPAVISGDCLIALGVVAGVQRTGVEPAIVWFDAHGDVHTLDTTTSGYLGGLALRLVLGAHPELIADRLGLRPLAERDALLVGARDLDPAEVDYLALAEIRRCGVEQVNADVLPDGPLVLHVDVDVIDSAELPGLRFPVSGGPSAAAVVAAARRVLDTGRVVAVDIACPWHPGDRGQNEARASLLTRITDSRLRDWGP
ncbi:MAG TPA: arginase family protein [Pseudonocardiaceae bacterium]|jgi:arginase|nr:arginase family protein [Pseudonocardiaceae bacterium]